MNFVDPCRLIAAVVTGVLIYYALLGRVDDRMITPLVALGSFLVYIYPLLFVYATWKHALPKKTVTQYMLAFGMPYDVGKERVTWKNMGGFDENWVQDEEVAHTHPVDHIDYVYSVLKVPGVTSEHVCIVAEATGSIFLDTLKEEATARCHYLVKNAVSLGFVQDVVAGSITKEMAREEYARRIINNVFPSWFPDPLQEAERTVGSGGHHIAN